MTMTFMILISGEMKRYAGVLSREVRYRYAIQRVIHEVRCVLKVCADTLIIGHKHEGVRADSVRVVMQRVMVRRRMLM